MKLEKITVRVTENQENWLNKHSVTRKNAINGNGYTKSEHVRKAIDKYIKKMEDTNNEIKKTTKRSYTRG